MSDPVEILKAKLPGKGNIPEQWATELLAALRDDGWALVRYEPHGGLSGWEYDNEGNRLQRATILQEWTPE